MALNDWILPESLLSFLTNHRILGKTVASEMNNRPKMRRDGTTFVPRVRGSSESISRVGGAAGILQERPKK
jgi:hypothetical protein